TFILSAAWRPRRVPAREAHSFPPPSHDGFSDLSVDESLSVTGVPVPNSQTVARKSCACRKKNADYRGDLCSVEATREIYVLFLRRDTKIDVNSRKLGARERAKTQRRTPRTR